MFHVILVVTIASRGAITKKLRSKVVSTHLWSNYSDLTRPHPKWWFSKGNPLISGKSRLVKYYNLARSLEHTPSNLYQPFIVGVAGGLPLPGVRYPGVARNFLGLEDSCHLWVASKSERP